MLTLSDRVSGSYESIRRDELESFGQRSSIHYHEGCSSRRSFLWNAVDATVHATSNDALNTGRTTSAIDGKRVSDLAAFDREVRYDRFPRSFSSTPSIHRVAFEHAPRPTRRCRILRLRARAHASSKNRNAARVRVDESEEEGRGRSRESVERPLAQTRRHRAWVGSTFCVPCDRTEEARFDANHSDASGSIPSRRAGFESRFETVGSSNSR